MKSKQLLAAFLSAAMTLTAVSFGASAQTDAPIETEVSEQFGAYYDDAYEYISSEALYYSEEAETEEAIEIPELTYSKLTYKSVSLSWDKVSGASKYRIYKYSSAKKKYLKYKDVTGTSATVSGLKSKTSYKFYISAIGSNGKEITRSDSITVTTPAKTAEKLAAPTGLTSTSKTQKTVTLKWNKVSGASAYRVYKYSSAKGTYVKYKDVTKTTCKVSGLKAGTTYKFAVAALVKKDGKYVVQTRSGDYTVTTTKAATTTPTDGKDVKPGKWVTPNLGDSMSSVLKSCGIGKYTTEKDTYTANGKKVVGTAIYGGDDATIALYFNSDGNLYEYVIMFETSYSLYVDILDSVKKDFDYDYQYSDGFYFFGESYCMMGLNYDDGYTFIFVSSDLYQY